MMEMLVTTEATKCARLQSNHHHQQTNTSFSQVGCPSCHPTNSVKAMNGKVSHSMDLITRSSPGSLATFTLITKGCSYLVEGLPSLSSAL